MSSGKIAKAPVFHRQRVEGVAHLDRLWRPLQWNQREIAQHGRKAAVVGDRVSTMALQPYPPGPGRSSHRLKNSPCRRLIPPTLLVHDQG